MSDTQEDFVWLRDGLNSCGLYEAIGTSIGAGSMCWVGGTGDREFDSVRAKAIVEGLVAYLSDWGDQIRQQANDKTTALPNLGLATTEELLAELQARGEVPFAGTPDGSILYAISVSTRKSLSPEALAYRTVGK